MLEKVFLNRFKSEKTQTLGELIYNSKVIAKTMELPDLGNKNRISCIPLGSYKVVRRYSLKHGNHFHVLNVPKRSYILMHHANYYRDLLGCIGVGQTHTDIDGDGYLDITSSKKTMRELLNLLPIEFELVIS